MVNKKLVTPELIEKLHHFIAQGTYEHLKLTAPGIAEPAKRAIANNLAIKLSRKLETEIENMVQTEQH